MCVPTWIHLNNFWQHFSYSTRTRLDSNPLLRELRDASLFIELTNRICSWIPFYNSLYSLRWLRSDLRELGRKFLHVNILFHYPAIRIQLRADVRHTYNTPRGLQFNQLFSPNSPIGFHLYNCWLRPDHLAIIIKMICTSGDDRARGKRVNGKWMLIIGTSGLSLPFHSLVGSRDSLALISCFISTTNEWRSFFPWLFNSFSLASCPFALLWVDFFLLALVCTLVEKEARQDGFLLWSIWFSAVPKSKSGNEESVLERSEKSRSQSRWESVMKHQINYGHFHPPFERASASLLGCWLLNAAAAGGVESGRMFN